MTNTKTAQPVKTSLWTEGLEGYEGHEVYVNIERTDPDEVAFFTMIDDAGSDISYYWSRSRAIEVARQILNAASDYETD